MTFWGSRAALESVSLNIDGASKESGGLGWLQILPDLIEHQGLHWREEVDPASGYPFSEHADGMPPVPSSTLRATSPDKMLGHSPFSDRSNLSLAFRGSSEVGILLQVVAERVPAFVDARVDLVHDGGAHQWNYSGGKCVSSRSWSLES